MIKKIAKYFKIISIDVYIYSMTINDCNDYPTIDYSIESERISKNKQKFFVKKDGRIIHKSYLFQKLFLLSLINKKGPAIGDCSTISEYKGKSIYPYVINYIAKEEIIKNGKKEVYIIVNTDNISSIRGIEKAGFKLYSKIKAKRFLLFYFNVSRN